MVVHASKFISIIFHHVSKKSNTFYKLCNAFSFFTHLNLLFFINILYTQYFIYFFLCCVSFVLVFQDFLYNYKKL